MNKHVYTERGLVADIKSEQGFYVGDICYEIGREAFFKDLEIEFDD